LRRALLTLAALGAAGTWMAQGGDTSHSAAAKWIEAQGGEIVRDANSAIVEISLARTWATDSDIEHVIGIKGL